MEKIYIIIENYVNDNDGIQTSGVHSAYRSKEDADRVLEGLLKPLFKEARELWGLCDEDIDYTNVPGNHVSVFKDYDYDSYHHDYYLKEVELQ